MRKRIIGLDQKPYTGSDRKWLDVEKLAVVEVSSENDAFPIESALLPDTGLGWRASSPGKQIIRLIFDNPQRFQRIRLCFEELEMERTQEFVLRWSKDEGQSYQDIVRQQWNFSPDGETKEVEEYQITLPEVTTLELAINPDISGTNAIASLNELRLA